MNMQPNRYTTLSLLEQEGPMSAGEIAAQLGLRRETTSMCLLRARRHGLAGFNRRRGLHSISERGRERLAWIREHSSGGSP
jgi:DNA-binding MarR family transcriptional regulator